MPHKLRQQIQLHTADIRAISIINDHEFVSSSRDMTSVIWGYNPQIIFQPKMTLLGHKGYVCCCCILGKSDSHPEGLIVTGSQDKTIRVYDPNKDEPIRIIFGHSNTVSALTAISTNTFASGSWDATIRIWNMEQPSNINTISRHSASIFALLLLKCGTIFISASADKTIIVHTWPVLGLKYNLTGHSDCVRSLVELTECNFLSCSNDGQIIQWNAQTGTLQRKLFTHDSFLYSVAALEDASLIVAGGENNTLVIIQNGEIEILKLPALSVWSVGILPNGDIITGSSDGYSRMFTQAEERQAVDTELERYEAQIKEALESNTADDASEQCEQLDSNLKVSDLPGPEILTKPGDKEGRIVLVREKNNVVCYQWSASVSNWVLVGDVTGTEGNPHSLLPKSRRKKIIFEGKEYDFVFDIDVKDGCPPLKLPYSIGSNPYDVADDFLIKHDLPQQYRINIVNFLLEKTPSSDRELNNPSNRKPEELPLPNPFFPTNTFISFDSSDFSKVKDKLISFTNQLSKSNLPSRKTWVDDLISLAKNETTPTDQELSVLRKCFEWPQEYIFPILDVTRFALTHLPTQEVFCKVNSSIDLLSVIRTHSSTISSVVNNMLTIKILSNMALHKPGQDCLVQFHELLLNTISELSSRTDRNKALEVAIASLLLNMIILQIRRNNKTAIAEYFRLSLVILNKLNNNEAILRILVGIGTAIHNLGKSYLRTDSLYSDITKFTRLNELDDTSIKIRTCAVEIARCIEDKVVS